MFLPFVLRNTPLTMYSLLWVPVIPVNLIRRYPLDQQSLDLSFAKDKNGLQSLLKHWKLSPRSSESGQVYSERVRAQGGGRGMTREGDDASWGDLADDEIWGPATRRYALFSHRPLLSSPLHSAGWERRRHNNRSGKSDDGDAIRCRRRNLYFLPSTHIPCSPQPPNVWIRGRFGPSLFHGPHILPRSRTGILFIVQNIVFVHECCEWLAVSSSS